MIIKESSNFIGISYFVGIIQGIVFEVIEQLLRVFRIRLNIVNKVSDKDWILCNIMIFIFK